MSTMTKTQQTRKRTRVEVGLSSDEDPTERKRRKNRESQRKTREKKNQQILSLQQENAALRAEADQWRLQRSEYVRAQANLNFLVEKLRAEVDDLKEQNQQLSLRQQNLSSSMACATWSINSSIPKPYENITYSVPQSQSQPSSATPRTIDESNNCAIGMMGGTTGFAEDWPVTTVEPAASTDFYYQTENEFFGVPTDSSGALISSYFDITS